MSLLEILREVAARLVWIREEAEPLAREQALEELELDVVGWLAQHEERA
jgi:hypothetical protein